MKINVEYVSKRDGIRIVKDFYDCTNHQAEEIVELWNNNNSIINYLPDSMYYTMYEWLYISVEHGYTIDDLIDE